jgi:hypothetical protein
MIELFDEKTEKQGLMDDNYNIVIEPIYDYLSSANIDGSREIILNEKWGLLDKNLKLVVEPIYDMIEALNNGYRILELNNKYGLLDKNFNDFVKPIFDFDIIKPIYDYISDVNKINDFKDLLNCLYVNFRE